MDKKILVTGGAGFIGSNIVEELLNRKYKVTVIDNLSSGYKENLTEFENKINFIEGDIRDYDLINKELEDCEAVIHLAAMISIPESVEKPQECNEINFIASKNIIDKCIERGIKFIFASSAAVYGEDESEIKTELIKPVPISPYGKSKLDVERYCMQKEDEGLVYTCFRNFNVYGPKQKLGSDYSAVIPIFINKCLKNNDLEIYGDGEQTRDFIFVGDVVSAYLEPINSKIIGIYNLGCNDIVSVNKLAEMIIEKTNSSSKIIHKEARAGDIKHSRASSQSYTSKSHWLPKISLSEGIDKSIEYYKNEN